MATFAKDPSNVYQKAYYDKLDKQISILPSGKIIPVYDVVPSNAVAPYIILSSINLTPIHNSEAFIYSATILLDIVTRFPSGGGKKQANDIANQVFGKVSNGDTFYSDDEWNIYTGSLNDSRIIESQSTDGYVVRKLVTFKNTIQQL